MNKRGIEEEKGVNWGVALLVFAVAAVIIYFGYSYFTTTSQYLPGDLSALAAACNSYAALGDYGKVDYCITPREIAYGRETRYVNCEFSMIKPFITDKSLEGKCEDTNAINTMCAQLQAELGGNFATKVICVNNERCTNSKAGNCGGGTVIPASAA